MDHLGDHLGILIVFGLARLGLMLGLCLFLPAGTFHYWQGWGYFGIFMGCSILATAFLARYDPALLRRRAKAGAADETRPVQKWVKRVAWIGFLAILVVPSLDRRFGRSKMPPSISIAGDVIVLFSFLMIFVVFRENSFAGSTVEVADDQKVISTGLYALVRHPMYLAGLLLLAAAPVALGSWWGLLVFVPLAIAIVWRLLDEEKFLLQNLRGYREYCQKVRYRLLPPIW